VISILRGWFIRPLELHVTFSDPWRYLTWGCPADQATFIGSDNKKFIFGRAQSEAVSEVDIRIYIRMLSLHPLFCISDKRSGLEASEFKVLAAFGVAALSLLP
jgi:hypothetical protein